MYIRLLIYLHVLTILQQQSGIVVLFWNSLPGELRDETENTFSSHWKDCFSDNISVLQVPLSFLVDERQLLFIEKWLISENNILHAPIASSMAQQEILGLASKFVN